MTPPRPTELAQMILRAGICDGDTVIDATAGNGHDTVFLAQCVGSTGRVLAFDVQDEAIQSATRTVENAGYAERVEFHPVTHVRMAEFAAPESVSTIMFNLGYLPGHDHAFTTRTSETIAALDAAAGLLVPGGVLSVVCYPGHAEGAAEAERVEDWFASQSAGGWRTAKYAMTGTRRPAPFLLLSRKPA